MIKYKGILLYYGEYIYEYVYSYIYIVWTLSFTELAIKYLYFYASIDPSFKYISISFSAMCTY
jgi:hypothetical protein